MEDLNKLRHSAAHLLAAAVLEYYPDAKPTIGPAIENGFYYDFDFSAPIGDNDLAKIEQKMKELVKKWGPFEKMESSYEDALARVGDNPYKKELIEEIHAKGEPITFYKSGEFVDLCRGGHVDNPKEQLKHFKLLHIAGAYWRGDEKNKMLTRIYGTAFATKEELDKHLWMLDEAKKRDHKKLGKELDLFFFSDLVGPGLPLWTAKGTTIRRLLDQFVTDLRLKAGYELVTIPHLAKKDLYETSGHWQKFANELFKVHSREGHEFVIKPMNCPHHTQIFAHIPRSYKDMPQRYTETTMIYRDEQTGELSGLSRVRSVTQDDSHVFCRKTQIRGEFERIWNIVDTFYGTFGFELRVRLSFHDPAHKEAYLGTSELWQQAESTIKEIAKDRNADFFEALGEAAFYGPKIDFMARDSLGRSWQVATIQLDFNQPERFNLFYMNEEGKEERAVMLHCAVMGSIERFMSILIEHYAGAFPLWLAPIQVRILPVSERHLEYAEKVAAELQNHGIRTELDRDNKTLGAKIRQSTLQKVPYMVIIGDKEVESSHELVGSIRTREGKDEGMIPVQQFIPTLQEAIEKHH